MERVRDILKSISTQIIVGTIVSVVVTVVAGVWAGLSRLDGLYIFLIVIGVLCLSVVMVNQLDGFIQRRKKPLFEQSSSHIDSTLRDWLYRGSFSVMENTQEGFEFAFVARDRQGRPVFVSKPNDRDEILLESPFKLRPNETENVQKLEPEEKRRLVSELRISLARHQVQYRGLDLPIKRIDIVDILVLDESFTRDVFMSRVDRVRYAFVMVGELLSPVLERKVEAEKLPKVKMEG